MEKGELKGRTKAFALRVIRLYGALPRTGAGRVIGDQVLRSGTSVGANYREASQARSKAEFIAKLGDSLKEIEESQYWLELLAESAILPSERLADLQQEAKELTAILITSINTAKSTNKR
jgi:four helix bundle protein